MNRLTWCLGILSLLALGQHSLAAEGWLRNGVSSTVGFVGQALRTVTQYAKGKDAPPKAAISTPVLNSLGRELKCTGCAAVPCCCPDDYCRKPLPQLCWPANPDCHCGPDCDGHAGHSQKAWTRVRFWP